MTIIPYTFKKVGDGLHIKVSKHFFYDDFGVRDFNEMGHYGRRFICAGTPGTGFIERDSESHSYHEFVRHHMAVQHPKYLNLLFDKEPNYERELKRAKELLHNTTDERKREIVDCYINALTIGRMEEEMQRIIRGVKDKMGHNHKKHLVSIISHFKRRIAQLERDMSSVEYHLEKHYSDETWQAYEAAVEAFSAMVHRCRRVWHRNDKAADNFKQVFFDLGIFDFIRADCFMPMMRDSEGVSYYLLPDAVIVARSSVDFDILPLKTLTMVCQETAIEETTELLSSRVGDAACMILIPGLNLTFYFNHARVVVDFVQAVDKLKATL